MTSPSIQRATAIFDREYGQLARRTDRMFMVLLVIQWVAAIAFASVASPYTWAGKVQATHGHVYTAVLLGGVVTWPPVVLALLRPGTEVSRYVLTTAQLLWSGLLIHLTGGRIETHFHIFGSLGFVAFYKDFRLLVPATVIVAADHFGRGLYWPESIYGVANPEWWRFLEHAGWVLFIDVFLAISTWGARKDMWVLAKRQATLEAQRMALSKAAVELEQRVVERTAELEASESTLRAILDNVQDAIVIADLDGRVSMANQCAMVRFGLNDTDVMLSSLFDLDGDELGDDDGEERVALYADGTSGPVEVASRVVDRDGRSFRVCVVRDLRLHKAAALREAKLQASMQESSRRAGMAFVASRILHNLGNALNSANVSLHLLRDHATTLPVARMESLGRLLAQHARDGIPIEVDKAASMKRYVDALASGIEGERAGMLGLVDELEGHLERIQSAVDEQRELATAPQFLQEIDPMDTVRRALDLLRSELVAASIRVRVKGRGRVVRTDRHSLLSILTQLFRHAVASMKHGGVLTVETSEVDGVVTLAVSHNGLAIPGADRTRVFEEGFGRESGDGFGLHGSANAARAMGATLTLASTEDGEGARFEIRFPCEQEVAA